nr:hypothetical protein [Kibdelosporangium sp. MJ126-NF4]
MMPVSSLCWLMLPAGHAGVTLLTACHDATTHDHDMTTT